MTFPQRLWARALTYRVLLLNSGSLLGATAVTAGLGFFYQLAAARSFSQEAVGLGFAAISAMQLIGQLGMMGLGTLLIGEMPHYPGKTGGLIATALIISGVVSTLFGVMFLVIVPSLTPEFNPLTTNLANIALFCLGVMLTAITLVLDQVLIGMLRGGLQFWRNFVFAAFKLVVLIILGRLMSNATGMDIYITWMLGNIVSLALVLVVAWRGGVQWRGLQLRFGLMFNLARSALIHHVLNLGITAPNLVLPIVVTIILGAAWNASFYAAWMLIYFLTFVPAALTLALYAETAPDTRQLAGKMRVTLLLSFAIGAAGCAVLFVGADLLLSVFNPNYAEQAGWCLRLMALSVFPQTLKIHYMTVYRVHKYIAHAAFFVWVGSVLEIAFAGAGAVTGHLTGLGMGFLIASILEGLVALPVVQRLVRQSALPFEVPAQPEVATT